MRKKERNDIQISFSVVWYCISKGWKVNKLYFVHRTLRLLVDSVLPFVNLFFMPKIIDELFVMQRTDRVIQYAVCMVLLDAFLGRVSSYTRLNSEKYASLYDFYLEEQLTQKTMEMDFELTENKVALDQLQKAKNGIGSWSNGIVGLIEPFFDIIRNLIVVSGVIMILILNGPGLIFLCIVGMILEAWVNQKFIKVNTRVYKRQSLVERIFNYTLVELVDFRYAKDIRLYHAVDMMMNKTEHEIDGMVQIQKDRVNEIMPWSVMESLILCISKFLMYAYLGIRALKGMITIGTFTQLLTATNNFGGSLTGLVSDIQGIIQKSSYFNEYIKFMNYPSRVEEGTKKVEDMEHTIEFRDVSFHYPNTNVFVLKHLSITIHPGEHLSIVGLNGAGKTTFIKLLCRLYEVDEGEILLDGVNIKEYEMQEYLKLLAVVFQDFRMFSFSIKQNIVFDQEESDEKVLEICSEAGIRQKIDSLKDGLQTNLFKDFEENGIELSGGEQQKLAIARAIYKDAPIVILDEPTAALDPVAEYEIYSKFDTLIGGKTAIYISHRLSSCKFCDHIAVFSEGTIKEYGTHDELVNLKDGIYAEMFQAQAQYYG